MELTPSLIYWMSRFEMFQTLCLLLGIFTMIGAAILGIFMVASKAAGDCAVSESTGTAFKRVLPVGVILCLLSCFLPDTKTVAAMYVVPKIANNESLDEVASSMKTLALEWMDELRPSKHRNEVETP